MSTAAALYAKMGRRPSSSNCGSDVSAGNRAFVTSASSLSRLQNNKTSDPPQPSRETSSTTNNLEDKIIEEKRRRANGDGYTIHKYTLGRLLGKGGFAKVYLCTAMDTGKNYAVKVVPKANLVKARARQKLQAEIKIHRTLKHRYICAFKHYFEDRNNCYILLELCHNQSLNEMIKRRKRLTEPEAAYFMTQLLEATRYMHEVNVIHRDLKLGNLFLDRSMNIKVGDLGLATRVESSDEKRKTICGTPNYIAPEIIQGDKAKRGHSFEVDVWSMGVILFTVLVGKPPYEAKDVKATYQRILNNEYSFPRHIEVSTTAKSLIRSMLQSSPTDRPTLDEIEQHPFLNNDSVPDHLPASTLSLAPTWRLNDDGELVCHDKTSESGAVTKMASLPRTSRLPFGSRDPNTRKDSSFSSTSLSKRDDGVNMERVVKTALARMNGESAPVVTNRKSTFKIYDETKPAPSALTEEALAKQTACMSLKDMKPAATVASTICPKADTIISGFETEADVFQYMVDQIESVLSSSPECRVLSPTPLSSVRGPTTWVTRYVDYTSKYGLGFMLNNGASGVYFNDATKTVLEPEGDTFQYIERKRIEDDGQFKRRGEKTVEYHTLDNYPETLKKKVTLLKHFRNYLVQQQFIDGDDDNYVVDDKNTTDFIYIQKWVRTKHAILFSLSNRTVQVVFYDQSEILLTPDMSHLTYVDKHRKRSTYSFADVNGEEIEKRLRYTKEILLQLFN